MFRVNGDSSLASEIKTARDRAALSQVELAQKIGVSARTVQNWEAGEAFPQPKHRRAVLEFIKEAA